MIASYPTDHAKILNMPLLLIFMGSSEQLESRIEPILNPGVPDREATEELIKCLSTALDHPTVHDYVQRLIDAVVQGYEIQSGQAYDGFLPSKNQGAGG